MTFEKFKELMLSPATALAKELKDPENTRGLKPGLIWLAVAQAIFVLCLMALTWTVGLFLQHFTNLPFWVTALSVTTPFSDLMMGVQAWILTSLGFLCMAYCVDFFMGRLFGAKQGQQRMTFNLMVKSILPWEVLIAIPILGWIVLFFAALWASLEVIRVVYGEKDIVRRGAGLIVSGVVSWVVQMAALMVLVPLVAMAYSMDPFHRAPEASMAPRANDLTMNREELIATMNSIDPKIAAQLKAQLEAGDAAQTAAKDATPTPSPVANEISSGTVKLPRPVAVAKPVGQSKAVIEAAKSAKSVVAPPVDPESSSSAQSPSSVREEPTVVPAEESAWRSTAADTAKKAAVDEGAKQLMNLFH